MVLSVLLFGPKSRLAKALWLWMYVDHYTPEAHLTSFFGRFPLMQSQVSYKLCRLGSLVTRSSKSDLEDQLEVPDPIRREG